MEWQAEKEVLLATIRRQEQEAATLAKRFKLLQQTLKEQQKLLDRYQHALSSAKSSTLKTQQTATTVDRTSNNIKTSGESTSIVKTKEPTSSTWVKKKTARSLDLETIDEIPASIPVKEVQENNEKKTVFKTTLKRRDGLAATWAEEKRRTLKKSKWEQTLELTASGANKETVRTGQTTDKRSGFAYVEVVRNREERKALPGHDCMECKKYYDALGGLDAVDAAAHKNKCSRHRARFEPYQTPDDFWRLSFPDSEPEPRSPSIV
ncbi:DNA endonuclease RBBP8 [Phytophthora nicotianae]|uniref:DNA endonuclease RBBP8 n=1 Tax=Phytophthora nicotianae TaxID=4792 RepID=A0A0W8DEV7_PHYNI|nr:DNA endonuclease RBBP8 [Phytophthora nicotianae]